MSGNDSAAKWLVLIYRKNIGMYIRRIKVMQQLPGVRVAQAATCESVVYVVLSDTMVCRSVRLLLLRRSRRHGMGRVISLTGTSSSTTCHMRDGAIAVPLPAVPCPVPPKELARFRGQSPGSHDDGSQMMKVSLMLANHRLRSMSDIVDSRPGGTVTWQRSENRVRVRPTNPIRRQLGRSGSDNLLTTSSIREGPCYDSPSTHREQQPWCSYKPSVVV
jgi:hypothetical protein